MFSRSSVEEQSPKLLSTLSYVISKLNRLADIMDEVEKLARRHLHYGVQDEHYTQVGRALIWTLEAGLADKWNRDLKEAWTLCYTTLAEAMMKAAKVPEQGLV